MQSEQVYRALESAFGFPFTPDQERAAMLLACFVASDKPQPACILRGFAGTGKTSLVAALVRVVKALGRTVVLLAPTGRAAKVFSRHAGLPAFTVHRAIYRQETFQGEGTRFSLNFNKLRHALFVVDEASMISSMVASSFP